VLIKRPRFGHSKHSLGNEYEEMRRWCDERAEFDGGHPTDAAKRYVRDVNVQVVNERR